LALPTYRVEPLTASALGLERWPPDAIWVGEAQPLVVVWLHEAVETTVSELDVAFEFATKTLPTAGARATASGAVPVVTELAAAKLDGLLVVPSLSTLSVLLDWLATYSVPVLESATCATGAVPVGAAITPLTLQPSEPWSPEATKTDWPSRAAAYNSVFSALCMAEGT
jgi:hypothetical protein